MVSFDSRTRVAIVGAGPYGLSLASHLSHHELDHRIFGRPMQAWRNMYPGMSLKSVSSAVSVYTPRPDHTFVDYCQMYGRESSEPVSVSLFVEYGLWAQQRLVPHVEDCLVERVAQTDEGFAVTLETGERLLAGQVVIATGLTYWKRMPAHLEGLGPDLVSHTSDHTDLSAFRGRDVVVVGAGQSALEAAALLQEAGANTQLLARSGPPAFADPPTQARPFKERLMYLPSRLGPGKLNFVLDRAPTAAHHLLSDERRVRLTRTHLGPLGAWWLRPRFEGRVTVRPGCQLMEVDSSGSGLCLSVRNGEGGLERLEADHVLCGTGYEVDVDRHEVLDEEIKRRVRRIERAPRLTRHFETSVPGLYFVGNGAAFSFGPLFRFVAGAAYTAPALSRHLVRVANSTALSRMALPRVPGGSESGAGRGVDAAGARAAVVGQPHDRPGRG
ncbi:MAG: NAD(P)/FAD-dependent oxidoreductase [Candidatus Dormibacteraeota bacterium]|nr:NAD(P)/FAD-dependent oxidoreductase [Candidatus Dormibacteraeota bacterium]